MASASATTTSPTPTGINNNVQILEASELPISAITVYTDRAEVQRIFSTKLAKGFNQVSIENVAQTIYGDSIRVDGRGAVTSIHEVQFKEEMLADDKVTNSKIDSLKAELEKLRIRHGTIKDVNGIIEKQYNAVGDILTSVCKSIPHSGGNPPLPRAGTDVPPPVKFDAVTEQSLESLWAYHERKGMELKERQRAQNKEAKKVEEQIQHLERELQELWQKGRFKRSISITLENGGEENAEVQLVVTYQVHSAHWEPSYDVRVQMDEAVDENSGASAIEQLRTVQLSYFGQISQDSGEKWENVQLTLSTANPNTGTLPQLGTTFAQFIRPEPPMPPMNHMRTQRSLFGGAATASTEGFEQATCFLAASAPKIGHAQTEAREQLLSATFRIPHPKTIPDDGSEHKVTIAILNVPCQPHLDCVPSKNTNVFLSTTLLNNTAFELLSGPVSVYLNNCFNQKTNIQKPVPINEKFDVPLGVYSAVKVTYKPAHQFHHQTGMINKNSNLAHEQKVGLHNTRLTPTLLTLIEPVPKPTDEKIKIRLISPEFAVITRPSSMTSTGPNNLVTVAATNAGANVKQSISDVSAMVLKPPVPSVRLNADNNLEWTVLLEGGKEMELCVKWEVEYPATEKIEFRERK